VIREKKKGDSLVENGMYVSAIQVYRKLLEDPQLEKVRAGLTESVFHNLGCAYSYLFQMEKALECFFKAWECNKSSEAMKAYLLAYKSAHTADEFKNRLNALAVDGETRAEVAMALEEFAKIPEKKVEPDQIDTQIRQFIRDYHRSTGS
jgi:tetratricopeptide (TPR) repeat protein